MTDVVAPGLSRSFLTQLNANFASAMPYSNVKSFGAAGDGVTNDALAISNAIASAAAAGGAVFFPPGTYVCGSQITASSIGSIIMVGCGPASAT